jgi:Sel1 repeat
MNSRAKVRSLMVTAMLLAATGRVLAMRPQDSRGLMVVKVEANAGNPEAQFLLGLRYGLGDGVREDPVRAESWLRVAAESGLVEAQSALGEFYLLFGPEYAQEGEKWLTVAAEKGDGQSTALLESLSAKVFLGDQPQSPAAGVNPVEARPGTQAGVESGENDKPIPLAGLVERPVGKPPITLLPGQDLPRKQETQVAVQREEKFSSGEWWILGALAVVTLSSLLVGRRS